MVFLTWVINVPCGCFSTPHWTVSHTHRRVPVFATRHATRSHGPTVSRSVSRDCLAGPTVSRSAHKRTRLHIQILSATRSDRCRAAQRVHADHSSVHACAANPSCRTKSRSRRYHAQTLGFEMHMPRHLAADFAPARCSLGLELLGGLRRLDLAQHPQPYPLVHCAVHG